MADFIDLQSAQIINSPDVRSWRQTIRITRIEETAAGGFVLTFDRPIPDSWKWPSNPANPADNFQYTVWVFKEIGGVWMGAGFVQMWQGRPMGTRALPPFLQDVDGAPGFTRWWGDVRGLWGELSHYVPHFGDRIGFMVTAGNARLQTGVTSVPERSDIVMWPVKFDDWGGAVYTLDGEPAPAVDPPPASPPPATPPPVQEPSLLAILTNIETGLEHIISEQTIDGAMVASQSTNILLELQKVNARLAGLVGSAAGAPLPAPVYDGSVTIPFLGTMKITLTPRK